LKKAAQKLYESGPWAKQRRFRARSAWNAAEGVAIPTPIAQIQNFAVVGQFEI
jgi:hypothetical protein